MMPVANDNNIVPLENARRKQRLEDLCDDDLMGLAAANVKEAFAEILRRYQGLVRGFCRKWAGSGGEDLAQEAFVRLWRSREAYKPRNEFKAYLFTIVVNQCRNAERSRRRKPPMEELEPETVAKPVSADQLELILKKEKLGRVHKQIRKLSPKLKEAVLLRFAQELSYRQIAEITGSKEATVRSRVMLGIERMKKELWP